MDVVRENKIIYQSKNTQTEELSYKKLINFNDSRYVLGVLRGFKAH